MASMGPLICIVFEDPNLAAQAGRLAEFLQAPLNPRNSIEFSFRLTVFVDGLHLQDQQGRALQIDFLKDHLNYQRKGLRGKNELLAKALGYSKGVRHVLDLSAGLGIDAVFMTQLGFQVTALERSRLLFLLLDEALRRAPELQAKLKFVHADSGDYLRMQNSQTVEANYFDPMYPHKKKTALPKQEMVVFRDLVGNDEDAAQVLSEALKWPVSRVVVKRPLGAEELLPGVRHAFEGKVVRYDVYMRSL
jgi:16S rRNA (guanine1516-N2)-methyltransferase